MVAHAAPHRVGRVVLRAERSLLSQELLRGLSPLVADQVNDLNYVQKHRNTSYYKIEKDENGLFCGTGNVTLCTGAGARQSYVAVEEGVHEERTVDVKLAHAEAHFKEYLDDQLGHVGAEEDALYFHLPPVVCVLGFPQYGSILLLHHSFLFVDDVHSMAQVNQRGRGHKGDLQDPVMNVGYGKLPAVAGVFTSRFLGVAEEV